MNAIKQIVAGVVVSCAMTLAASPFLDSIRSVSSSGYYDGQFGKSPPESAFDGDDDTAWLSDKPYSQEIEFFLGVELSNGARPKSYTLSEKAGIALARRPKAFKLLGSVDGTSGWTELDSRTDIVWTSGAKEAKTFEVDSTKLPEGVYYRVFKLMFVEPSELGNTYAFSLTDMDMDVEFDPAGKVLIDIMEDARTSGIGTPFAVSSTGENEDGVGCHQLFDGDLTADSNKSSSQNGRALFAISKKPSVTISFDMSAFNNRQVFLCEYGFRMWGKVDNTGWNCSGRMPKEWSVYVSDAEAPAAEDWVLFDSRTSASYKTDDNGCLWANFAVVDYRPMRHVRFEFTKSVNDANYVQLGEICLSGLMGPEDDVSRDVIVYQTFPAEVHDDGSALLSARILPRGQTVDPYDLFFAYQTGGRIVTNVLASATTFTGVYEHELSGLRLGSEYVFRFGARSATGEINWGDGVPFVTPEDRMLSRLPVDYVEHEWIESTDGGRQYVDCGFAPVGSTLGFDFDFIGYNAFVNGMTEWTGNRDADYGVYLSSVNKGQNAQLLISSSTGRNGTYPSGLFLYGASSKSGTLTRGVRMQAKLDNGKYTTICGGTTNVSTDTKSAITGPNVFVFASGNGEGNQPADFAVMRLYSLKIYEDSVSPRRMTHDFVPACKIDDRTYGLYDAVMKRWCPNGGVSPFSVGPEVPGGNALILDSLRYTGRTLAANVTRGTAGADKATDVYAVWGTDYGGLDVALWQNAEKCGSFAAGERTAKFTTPNFSRDTVYVRFCTADGAWSETVYLPEQPVKSGGFMLILK